MGDIKTIAATDLTQALALLGDCDCVVDDANGVFMAKLPTRGEGFRILVHPAAKLEREVTLADGRVELVVRRG